MNRTLPLILLLAVGCSARSRTAVSAEALDALSAENLAPAPTPVVLSPSRMTLSDAEQADFAQRWSKDGALPEQAPRTVPVAHGRTHYRDGIWTVVTFESREGRSCLAEVVPGEGIGLACAKDRAELEAEPPAASAKQEEDATDKSRWDLVWLYDVVPAGTTQIEVRYTDCSATRHVPDPDGVFFLLVPPSVLRRGAVPYQVRGLDASGRVLYTAPTNVRPPGGDDQTIADYAPERPCD